MGRDAHRTAVRIVIAGVGYERRTPRGTQPILRDLCLVIEPGEVLVIRGPNGTGKTTLLSLIAGVLAPTTGSVSFEPLGPPSVGFVQQDYTSSLLPWLNVLDNVSLPLRLRGETRERRRAKAAKMLAELEFSNVPHAAYPHQLSGGQKQRVSLARALIADPAVLLLDEPFANLDTQTSRDLQELLMRVIEQRQITTVLVAHDVESTLYTADRIAFLSGKPASVASELKHTMPRPRSRPLVLSTEYQTLGASVVQADQESHERPKREA